MKKNFICVTTLSVMIALLAGIGSVWLDCLGKNLPHLSQRAQWGKKCQHSKISQIRYNAILGSFSQNDPDVFKMSPKSKKIAQSGHTVWDEDHTRRKLLRNWKHETISCHEDTPMLLSKVKPVGCFGFWSAFYLPKSDSIKTLILNEPNKKVALSMELFI